MRAFSLCCAGFLASAEPSIGPVKLIREMERYVPEARCRRRAMRRRKPELISVRMVTWQENLQIYGVVTEFDDGETYSEPWGSKEDTELAVRIRSQDIRRRVK